MSTKRKYQNGDCFGVPLRSGGYAMGVVTRSNRSEGIILGYFFGPRAARLPSAEEIRSLEPENAALIARVGDLGLISGDWPIIVSLVDWRDEAWPVPAFFRPDALSPSKGVCVLYDRQDPSKAVSEAPCQKSEADGMPRDGLYGAGALEIELGNIL
jgi:hypothetical protein